jgi:hypothetical protein
MPRCAILSGEAGTNNSSLCTFLEILSGNGPEYDFDDVYYYSSTRECIYINGDNPVNHAP